MKTGRYILARFLLKIPGIRYRQFVYKMLGVKTANKNDKYFIGNPVLVGSYSNLVMHDNSSIERNSFILAREKVEIGENTGCAYGVTILTGADPHGPKNKLAELYPPLKAPVIIGKNCWIGANAVILPGVKIGDCCIIAAGSVVTKDVPYGVLVAGNPAVIKKRLNI